MAGLPSAIPLQRLEATGTLWSLADYPVYKKKSRSRFIERPIHLRYTQVCIHTLLHTKVIKRKDSIAFLYISNE